MAFASVVNFPSNQEEDFSDLVDRDRSRSLLDLLHIYADNYIYIGRLFQHWINLGASSEASLRIGKSRFLKYKKALEELQEHCSAVSLTVSESLIYNAIQEAGETMSHQKVADKMGELQRCVEAELRSKYFFFIPSDRAKYLTLYFENPDGSRGERSDVGSEISRFRPCMEAFPSITHDLEQAGKCFATDGFTACVFHLMRICEYGLTSLARTLGADPEISSWEKLLRKIEIKIEENDRLHPDGWIKDRLFYAESRKSHL